MIGKMSAKSPCVFFTTFGNLLLLLNYLLVLKVGPTDFRVFYGEIEK